MKEYTKYPKRNLIQCFMTWYHALEYAKDFSYTPNYNEWVSWEFDSFALIEEIATYNICHLDRIEFDLVMLLADCLDELDRMKDNEARTDMRYRMQVILFVYKLTHEKNQHTAKCAYERTDSDMR